MKEGVSPADQIKWQKKVIGKQLRTIEAQKEEVGILSARVKVLEEMVERSSKLLKGGHLGAAWDCLNNSLNDTR
jgi:hypothetical protein